MNSIKFIFGFLIAATVLLTIGGCERENGTATFYFDQNGANATVAVGGQNATISSNYQSNPPLCGTSAAGCANFVLPAGTYNYMASSNTSSWSGSVTIVGNQCTEVLLTQSTGSVIFWTTSNSFGNITVNINNGSGAITSYITGGTPTCGFSGCATFDLVPGVYAYTASASQGGATWNGNVTITADGCQPVQFQ